jgi:glutathione peroxidase
MKENNRTIFDLSAESNRGETVDFNQYRGKVLLVVNTASKCGFTPQYDGLEALYQKYQDMGLEVIGFPCNQFAGQEPGSAEEIASFCKVNYGVTFPIMAKIKVNGPETDPVFKLLKEQAPGAVGKAIKWNFTKFLISRDGEEVKRFAPKDKPEEMKEDIERVLDQH